MALFKSLEHRKSWVIYQLALKGKSLSALAKKHGLHRQCLYSAFVRPYPKAEKIIADELSVTPDQLFPERYDENGLPNRKIGRPRKKYLQDSKLSRTGHS